MSFIDFLNKLLGDPNERELKRLKPKVAAVNKAIESEDIKKLELDDD
ncbi:hypothetical protein KKC44_03185 [Patescibacteria group bacterium]|nr:hypothetical protein [Patescibacteria group bacterium]MBU2259588.1 hypothetical protein [Patescibacteria group bacterium]